MWISSNTFMSSISSDCIHFYYSGDKSALWRLNQQHWTVCSTAGSTTNYSHLWGNPLVTGRFDKGLIIWQVFSFNGIIMICLMKFGTLSAGLQQFAMQICDTGRIILLFHNATLPNVGRYAYIYKSLCMGTSRWRSTIRLNICQGSHIHAMLPDIVGVWNACRFQTCKIS